MTNADSAYTLILFVLPVLVLNSPQKDAHQMPNLDVERIPIPGTTSSHYVHNAFEACVKLGCPEDELLALIPGGKLVLQNPSRRFKNNILFDMLHKAERITGLTGIGILVGEHFRPSALGDLGYAMVAADTLEDMISLYQDYHPLFLQLGTTKVEKSTLKGCVTWESGLSAYEYMRPYTEKFFSSVATFGRWVTWDQDMSILSVHFTHSAPADLSAYKKVFNCPVHFNEPKNMLEVPVGLLEHSMPQPNPTLMATFKDRLDIQLSELDQPISTERETFQVVQSMLSESPPTIIRVAEAMGTTERTLRRRLKEENATFRDILEAVRREVCETKLQSGICSIATLAQNLGYSEQSAFTRAFKGWYGVPPSQYIQK